MRHVSKAKLSLAVALAIAGFVMPNMVVDAAYTARILIIFYFVITVMI